MPIDESPKSLSARQFSTPALRYAVVSGAAFVVDVGLLLLLSDSMPLLIANSIAFLVANIAQFFVAHIWVFNAKLSDPRLVRTYMLVVLISIIGLLINDLVVWVSVVALGIGLVAAKLLATVVAWSWNYQARKKWIYRELRP